MDEYISLHEAIRAVQLSYGNYEATRKAIFELPAAGVAPVRHGKWMPFHAEFAGDIQYCSVCEIGFADRTSYCPHCGAVMDGWRVEGKENDD